MAPCRKYTNNQKISGLQSLKSRFNKTKAYCATVVNLWKINPKLILSQVGNIGKYLGLEKVEGKVECDNKICDLEKEKIYKQLMSNPKLHIIHADVPIISTDVQTQTKKNARHYAARLWNWRLVEKNAYFHQYLKNYLILTVKYMSDQDMQIMKTLLTNNHQCNCFIQSGDCEFRKLYLKKLIFQENGAITHILEAVHEWFLLMPVLSELAKLLGWDFLNLTKACLLDVDILYMIFLNVVYKTPQAKGPIYT